MRYIVDESLTSHPSHFVLHALIFVASLIIWMPVLSAKMPALDEWVSVEVEVHGNDEVIHRVNGVEVLRYQHPQLDPREDSAQKLMAAGAPLQISYGHIALQAESQEVWFRNIRIKQLAR